LDNTAYVFLDIILPSFSGGVDACHTEAERYMKDSGGLCWRGPKMSRLTKCVPDKSEGIKLGFKDSTLKEENKRRQKILTFCYRLLLCQIVGSDHV
jgi:hypothetical protein